LVYEFFGAPVLTEKEKNKTLDHWSHLTKSQNGNWVVTIKYKLAAFFSFHMGQELPPKPKNWPTVGLDGVQKELPGVLIGSRCYPFVREYLFKCSFPERAAFLFSVLQSKKGMPVVEDEVIRKKEVQAVEKLTAPAPVISSQFLIPWSDSDGLPAKLSTGLNRFSAEEQLRRTVREVFGEAKYTDLDRINPYFPSTSSTYNNTIKEGGQVGVLLDDEELLEGLRVPGGLLDTVRSSVVHKYTGNPISDTPADEKADWVYDESDLLDNFAELVTRALDRAMEEPPLVKPVGLAEPLKVRVITKGPPITYFVLKALQKFMFKIMRRQKTFRLIGTPNNEEELLNLLGKVLGVDEEFLSGDYAAATDNIHGWASEVVADEIGRVCELEENELILFKRALTGHVFDTENGTPEGFKKQASGQLMGSVVSFPVLCLINASMTRWAMELGERKLKTLRQCAMGVNGDDVAYKSKKETYVFWDKITSFVGLTNSIGKTFRSRDFVTINSRIYTYDPSGHLIQVAVAREVSRKESEELQDRGVVPMTYYSPLGYDVPILPLVTRERVCPYTEIGYVNMGLMLGVKKDAKDKADLDDPYNTIASRAEKLLQMAPDFLRGTVYKEFLRRHMKMLKATNVPWYLPTWIGGLGLPVLNEHNKTSDVDLRMARKILMNWNMKSKGDRKGGPSSFRPIMLGSKKGNWKIRELARKALPKPTSMTEDDPGVAAYEHLSALKNIDLLFDSNVKMENLMVESKKGKSRDATSIFKHNARLWKPSGTLPPAMTLEELQSQKKFEGLHIKELWGYVNTLKHFYDQ
jgi:hypothetical protein